MFIIASYDEAGVPDAMNAAWGGISEDTQLSMCLSAGHKTVKNILARGALPSAWRTRRTWRHAVWYDMVLEF